MDGPDGERLRAELEHLIGRPFRDRAPRRAARRVVRLQGSRYNEVVQLKDVSASGVRLLLRGDLPADLRDVADMTLTVRLPSGPTRLSVTAVRFCGWEREHMDIGFKFVGGGPKLDGRLDALRSYIFER